MEKLITYFRLMVLYRTPLVFYLGANIWRVIRFKVSPTSHTYEMPQINNCYCTGDTNKDSMQGGLIF